MFEGSWFNNEGLGFRVQGLEYSIRREYLPRRADAKSGEKVVKVHHHVNLRV
jgi:hypothetical protein